MKQLKRINMWSGPRNVSTAIMYSFAQRSDTLVMDEPFYAHYLLKSGVEHPGRAEVMESQPKDAAQVMQNLLSAGEARKILFLKNMAHHMVGMKSELQTLTKNFQHVFLIRDPAEMLPSLDKNLPDPTLSDTAYDRLLELFENVRSEGLPLHVIDARELLKNPEYVLSKLCDRLDIRFEKSMLSWKAGPIPEDGVWAKYWYQSVHRSTGFKPYKPKEDSVSDHLMPLYKKCKPIYDKLLVHAIKNTD